MARPATGQCRALADGRFEARIRIDDEGTRKGLALTTVPKGDEAAAEERTRALNALAVRLRAAGHGGKRTLDLLKLAARARPGKPWDAILAAVDALCTTDATRPIGSTQAVTFVAFATEWIDGTLHRRWPDHVPEKKSDQDERTLRLYVAPVLRDLPLADFALDHADQVMANLPERLGSASRRQVAQFVRRACALAVYPARVLPSNPIPRGWMPKVKITKAFTHVHPSEDRALLGCTAVPLVRRLFAGVLAREGLRRDELASLRWRDLDLDKGHVALDENKTDDPRSWALDPGVVRALSAWRERFRRSAADEHTVFSEDGIDLYVGHLARELRADLETAGVKRAALFERSKVRRPLRAHDLRATFVTVSLANGKTETWVADRTGHRSSEMINRYRRAARTWAELELGTLAPLDGCIPELGPIGPRAGQDGPSGAIREDLGAPIPAECLPPEERVEARPAGNHVGVQASRGFESLPLRKDSEPLPTPPDSTGHERGPNVAQTPGVDLSRAAALAAGVEALSTGPARLLAAELREILEAARPAADVLPFDAVRRRKR